MRPAHRAPLPANRAAEESPAIREPIQKRACVSRRTQTPTPTDRQIARHTHTHTNTNIYIYICIHMYK